MSQSADNLVVVISVIAAVFQMRFCRGDIFPLLHACGRTVLIWQDKGGTGRRTSYDVAERFASAVTEGENAA
ncbi:MAG: hypothetical protein C0606_12620 [Hyphomicrobiales bacterium]|nr:MAG: hypothetical protein C0606_12620 [Hyphomicrobiales bacterium]